MTFACAKPGFHSGYSRFRPKLYAGVLRHARWGNDVSVLQLDFKLRLHKMFGVAPLLGRVN
jgi:hypothetical protein